MLAHGKDLWLEFTLHNGWLMIGIGEGYLFGLSLGITLGLLLESPNTEAEIGSLFGFLTDTILGVSLGILL